MAVSGSTISRAVIDGAIEDAADTRIGGIAVCLAGHISQLGWAAQSHVANTSNVDVTTAVLAGLTVRDGDKLRNPFVEAFSLAVVTTDYELATDEPLDSSALNAKGLRYWLGINGATSGRERQRRASRATHLGAYPGDR